MSIKTFFFPPFCLGCKFLGVYICPDCEKKLSYSKKDKCVYCHKNSPYGLTHLKCSHPYGINGHLSIFHYNNFLKKIIKTIKYDLAIDPWREFQNLIKPKELVKTLFFKQTGKFFFIQPLPLHKNRLRQRGFNQSLLIAKFFQKYLNFPIVSWLERKKDTVFQAKLKKDKDRFLNLKGAFKIKVNQKLIKGKNIILIDDILTSGFSVKEAARTFKKGGVKSVYALTLAKG